LYYSTRQYVFSIRICTAVRIFGLEYCSIYGVYTTGYTASTVPTAHPAHRIAALTPAIRAEISRLSHAGLSTNQILSTLRISNPNITLIAKDIGNIIQQIRAEELNGRTPIQWLLEVIIKTLF
jgi:hypothetical protein